MDKNQYRVEVSSATSPTNLTLLFRWRLFHVCCIAPVQHLFTFELDGRQLRSVSDCVEQLQLLEEMGRVWGQNMLLGVQASKLMLMDIETKVIATEEPQINEIVAEKTTVQESVPRLWRSPRFSAGTVLCWFSCLLMLTKTRNFKSTFIQSLQNCLRTRLSRLNSSIKVIQVMLPWRYLTQQPRVSVLDLPIDQFRIVP